MTTTNDTHHPHGGGTSGGTNGHRVEVVPGPGERRVGEPVDAPTPRVLDPHDSRSRGEVLDAEFTTEPITGPASGPRDQGPGVVDGVAVDEPDDLDETTDPAEDGAEDAGRGARRLVDSSPEPDGGFFERLRAARRRPILPGWASSYAELAATARWVGRHWAHVAGYHALRAPRYAALLGFRAPRGLVRALRWLLSWVYDLEGLPARLAAVRRDDLDGYMKLSRQRDQRVRNRLAVAIPGGLAALGLVIAVWVAAPAPLGWALFALLVGVLGRVGAPADGRLLDTAVVSTKAAKLTSEIVVRAMNALGLAQINASKREGGGVTFPAPIVRDGPGWRATVDLPYGVTATDVLERRDRLASGLRRPLGCVWPEPVSTEHAGRLVLWVGDEDMAAAKSAAWPLAKQGTTSLFQPVPFATDQRGRTVAMTLMFANVLIGAMPRFGKTFALRVLMLAVALDPTAEIRAFELKGTGDLSAVEGCCHHYASGADDETIAACVASLREVVAELERRAKVIQKLPREVCPENKVTPELAANKRLGLHPLVVPIDECQELFTHPTHGAEAGDLATAIIKRGPAMGVILVLATQRPDSKSLPTGVSANAGIRFCLRVMGQTENDMVLGTSAYKNGIRATTFGAKDKGIGYLVGVRDDPVIARSYYLDGPAAETIGLRARAAREAAGRLSGHALGLDTLDQTAKASSDTVLGDLLIVFGDDDKTWSSTLVERLAAHDPDRYSGWKAEQLAAAIKPHGLRTGQVWAAPDGGGKPGNRNGLHRQAVADAVAQRDHDRHGG